MVMMVHIASQSTEIRIHYLELSAKTNHGSKLNWNNVASEIYKQHMIFYDIIGLINLKSNHVDICL